MYTSMVEWDYQETLRLFLCGSDVGLCSQKKLGLKVTSQLCDLEQVTSFIFSIKLDFL